MNWKRVLPALTALMLIALLVPVAFAQTLTTGSVEGTVTDPQGAVVANAPVTIANPSTGFKQTIKTDSNGFYRASLLQPGTYTVTVNASNFQPTVLSATVAVNHASNVNVQLSVSKVTTTVEVTAAAPMLQTSEAEVATTFNQQQVQLVPNPGNDLSYVAQTAPGAIMNTESGYGNFSTFGLPGTSNLFTLDGQNDNDPFLNLNNSGATNLLLGQNEIQEATVINNGYQGQYGQLAGSTVNYVTKSGTNSFHGNASWWWNGRVMNANDWFNNSTIDTSTGKSIPRGFDNANQWAASFGGPIVKDKTFFFVDYEGLRVVIPTSTTVLMPTPAFQTQILNNLTAAGLTASIPFYQSMFNFYNGAPGAAGATPSPFAGTNNGGCDGYSDTGANGTIADAGFTGGFGSVLPCTQSFRATPTNFTHEYLLAGRVDQVLGNNDRLFIRAQHDTGLQATYTDPISPIFNAQSDQPEWQANLSETHIFNPTTTNSLVVSMMWYTAIFKPKDTNATLAAFPTVVQVNDGSLTPIGGIDFVWPQGRNVTQYQFVDDVSKSMGKHNFKFGVNYHRNDVTDFDYGFFNTPLELPLDLSAFAGGGTSLSFNNISVAVANFPKSLEQPMALYELGLYAQDEWKVRSNLTLTLALRADHYSNPVCQTNCFADLAQPFETLPTDPTGSVPYNQQIITGRHEMSRENDAINWAPRIGFAWSPLSKTVVRGGFGLFYDAFPASLVDNLSQNPPLDPEFVSFCNNLSPVETGPNPVGPFCGVGATGNLINDANTANAQFQAGFASGASFATLSAANPVITAPTVVGSPLHTKTPRYQEWNLSVQQQIGQNNSVTLNYVGNHGIFELVQNNGLNAWCNAAQTVPCNTFLMPGAPNNVLPTSGPPNLGFSTVTQIQNAAVSNYHGLTATFQHRFHRGTVQVNYSWSHALDEISNGGLLPFNAGTAGSLLNPQDPFCLRCFNYGNADYDVRHYLSANYYYELPFDKFFHGGGFWKGVYNGWSVAGTVFARSGLPYTITDSTATGELSSFGYGATVYANQVGPLVSCGEGAAEVNNFSGGTPCLTSATATSPFSKTTGAGSVGNQQRNQFRGPGFVDTDFTVGKKFPIHGWENANLGFQVQFFNLFNHPNFDLPVRDVSDPNFGFITRTVNTPTSILGSFLGGDASPRLIQLNFRLTF